ncbi:MAG: VOC family protein [Gemmataceae bacterium]
MPMVIPHITSSDANKAIEFYKAAFGATEVRKMPHQDGKRIMFAELRIGDGSLYLNDDFPEFCGGKSRTVAHLGGTPVTLHMNVPDCDAAIKRAADAGAHVTMGASDMFWGDRYGQVKDPFGFEWSFSHPLKK